MNLLKVVNTDCEEIIDNLNDNNLKIRENAAAIIAFESNSFVFFKDEFGKPLYTERYELFRKIIRQKAMDSIVERLYDDSWFVKICMACTLGGLRCPESVDPLINSLEDREISDECAYNLIRLNDLSLESLKETTYHPEFLTKYQAIWALGEIGDITVIDQLFDALYDEETDIRLMAVESIGKIGAEHVPILEDIVILDESQDVRRETYNTLERMHFGERNPRDKPRLDRYQYNFIKNLKKNYS